MSASVGTRLRMVLSLGGLLLLPGLAFVGVTHSPRCISQTLLGVACPGCGLGRSFLALARLDPLAAATAYPPIPLLVLAYVLVLAVVIRGLVWPTAPRPRKIIPVTTALALGVAATVVGNWVIRLSVNL